MQAQKNSTQLQLHKLSKRH